MSTRKLDDIINEAIQSEGSLSTLIESLDNLTKNLQLLYSESSDSKEEDSNKNALLNNATDKDILTSVDIQESLTSLLTIITSINSIKNQLNILKFNTYEKVFVENCIAPFLIALVQLSSVCSSVMGATQLLNVSTTTKRKTSKIKKSEKTAYKILEQINYIYPIVECRLYELLNESCNCK